MVILQIYFFLVLFNIIAKPMDDFASFSTQIAQLEKDLPLLAANEKNAKLYQYATGRGLSPEQALDCISKLLDEGADVNFISISGRSVLENAALSKKVDLVRLLLQKGASPTINCPLYHAVCIRHADEITHAFEITKLLLTAGAYPYAKSNQVDSLHALEKAQNNLENQVYANNPEKIKICKKMVEWLTLLEKAERLARFISGSKIQARDIQKPFVWLPFDVGFLIAKYRFGIAKI